MPILFSISVLALIALLWASISAAKHIRRARRRKSRTFSRESAMASGRLGLQHAVGPACADEVSFKEVQPYSQAQVAKTSRTNMVRTKQDRAKVVIHVPEPPYLPTTGYVPKRAFTHVSGSVNSDESEAVARSPAEAKSAPTPVAVAEQALPEMHLPTPTSAPAPDMPPAATHRPLRPVSGRHTVSTFSKTMERPDWAYFNKDMGDLTDPYEAPRSRSKITSGESRH